MEDDADVVRLREELTVRDAVLPAESDGWLADAEGGLKVLVKVVVDSSSLSYVGVSSGSILIAMSASIQPGGNSIKPGRQNSDGKSISNPQKSQCACDGQKSCTVWPVTAEYYRYLGKFGNTHKAEMAMTPED